MYVRDPEESGLAVRAAGTFKAHACTRIPRKGKPAWCAGGPHGEPARSSRLHPDPKERQARLVCQRPARRAHSELGRRMTNRFVPCEIGEMCWLDRAGEGDIPRTGGHRDVIRVFRPRPTVSPKSPAPFHRRPGRGRTPPCCLPGRAESRCSQCARSTARGLAPGSRLPSPWRRFRR